MELRLNCMELPQTVIWRHCKNTSITWLIKAKLYLDLLWTYLRFTLPGVPSTLQSKFVISLWRKKWKSRARFINVVLHQASKLNVTLRLLVDVVLDFILHSNWENECAPWGTRIYERISHSVRVGWIQYLPHSIDSFSAMKVNLEGPIGLVCESHSFPQFCRQICVNIFMALIQCNIT